MEKEMTRKEFLSNTTKFAAGMAVGVGALAGKKAFSQTVNYDWPWPYATLDPDAVRIKAHDTFWNDKECCAGAFGGILGELKEVVGEPFLNLPMEIMLYGAGGVSGWGTICGALNGASAAISLVCDKATAGLLVNELVGWYTQTELPTQKSDDFAVNHDFTDNRCDVVLPKNICGSPLCHVSVTEWCKNADKKVADVERKERCARVAGDTAAQAVILLNAHFADTFESVYVTPDEVAACMTCHGPAVLNNVATKQGCQSCHGDPHATTDIVEEGGLPQKYMLEQNYPNPFNPKTTIPFSIPSGDRVTLEIYNVKGMRVTTLINGDFYSTGSYKASWNGMDDFGNRVSSGIYFARLRTDNYAQTKKMTLMK